MTEYGSDSSRKKKRNNIAAIDAMSMYFLCSHTMTRLLILKGYYYKEQFAHA
jgi:hypothetical protein